MLIDLHAHTGGISTCCKVGAPVALEHAGNAGLDGVVLANHYHKDYLGGESIDSFIKRFNEEFYYACECGKAIGIKVFYAIEVTMEISKMVHMLVYGVDTDFLQKHPDSWDYTQRELYDAVKSEGGVLVQAHPFRNGTTVMDTDYLDGVELNCHPNYKNTYCQELEKTATENKLILTCGGDYHADTAYRPKCGMYLPDNIENGIDLGNYLKTADCLKLCVHEPGTEEPFLKNYEVRRK